MKLILTTSCVLFAALFLTQPVSAETIIGGEVGNGNFEAEAFASKGVPYKDVSHWHLIGGSETSTTFGTTQGTNGSPDAAADGRSDRQAAYLFDPDDSSQGDRYAANDTGYIINIEGDSFSIEMALHKFGRESNYHGDEYIEVVLFTVAKNLNTSTDILDIEVMASTKLMVDSMWTTAKAQNFYTTTAADVGKTVYLGLELIDPKSPEGGRNIYPRIDAVQLTVETASDAEPS